MSRNFVIYYVKWEVWENGDKCPRQPWTASLKQKGTILHESRISLQRPIRVQHLQTRV